MDRENRGASDVISSGWLADFEACRHCTDKSQNIPTWMADAAQLFGRVQVDGKGLYIVQTPLGSRESQMRVPVIDLVYSTI